MECLAGWYGILGLTMTYCDNYDVCARAPGPHAVLTPFFRTSLFLFLSRSSSLPLFQQNRN